MNESKVEYLERKLKEKLGSNFWVYIEEFDPIIGIKYYSKFLGMYYMLRLPLSEFTRTNDLDEFVKRIKHEIKMKLNIEVSKIIEEEMN